MNRKSRTLAAVLLVIAVAVSIAGCAQPEAQPETEQAVDEPTLESLGATATVVEYLTSNDIEMITYLTTPELRWRVSPAQASGGPSTLTILGWYPKDADGTGNLARRFSVEFDGEDLPYNVGIERASPNDPWRVVGEGGAP